MKTWEKQRDDYEQTSTGNPKSRRLAAFFLARSEPEEGTRPPAASPSPQDGTRTPRPIRSRGSASVSGPKRLDLFFLCVFAGSQDLGDLNVISIRGISKMLAFQDIS